MSKMVVELDGATPLDPDEMEGLIYTHIQTRGQLDQLEQINVQSGMKWLKRQKKADPFTEAFVCDLHKKLFGDVWNWAGSFRKTAKELAARFHHRLVAIHPFPNGNGRHSRIMADAVLTITMNDESIDWAGGHDLQSMSDHRKNYIAALRAADQGDYAPLLKFVGA
jgi:fido (protein-threonine AMPylation protein)